MTKISVNLVLFYPQATPCQMVWSVRTIFFVLVSAEFHIQTNCLPTLSPKELYFRTSQLHTQCLSFNERKFKPCLLKRGTWSVSDHRAGSRSLYPDACPCCRSQQIPPLASPFCSPTVDPPQCLSSTEHSGACVLSHLAKDKGKCSRWLLPRA